jgi:hypothetical protein
VRTRAPAEVYAFAHARDMEMGQPPSVQRADPAMWVRSRQFTGRIVTVTNDKVFDEPVYNYPREFPFIWEEMTLPIPCRANVLITTRSPRRKRDLWRVCRFTHRFLTNDESLPAWRAKR